MNTKPTATATAAATHDAKPVDPIRALLVEAAAELSRHDTDERGYPRFDVRLLVARIRRALAVQPPTA